MSKPRLLWTWPDILDDVPEVRSHLEAFAQLTVASPTTEELVERMQGQDILVPRLSHEVSQALIDAAPDLRIIGTPSTGSDHIAVRVAEARGIRVVTIKDDRALLDSVQSTAELAWLLVLACSRRMREALRQVRAGGWNAMAVRGHELIGRTLGVVGYGRLGSMMGRFGRAFGMRVIATDPRGASDPEVVCMPLHDLLAESDIVSIHVHLDDSTRGLMGAAEFARMKRGAVLVNTSRGDVIDEDALLAALESGRLAAAGLDVITGERDADRNLRPLLRYAAAHDNLIITPHIGGCTVEAQAKVMLHFVSKLQQAWEQIVATPQGTWR